MASEDVVHGQTIDPEALNASERRILALLAEGHTVKSIAVTTGWSIAAINERLRVARRKTGVGSSRELARLLRAQENRDEEIGLAPGPDALPDAPSEAAAVRRGRWKGWIVMAAILLIGLAAGMLALIEQPQPVAQEVKDDVAAAKLGQSDPMLGNLLSSGPDLRELRSGSKHELDELLMNEGSQSVLRRLHARVRTEVRDKDWSARTEAALRDNYLALSRREGSGRPAKSHLFRDALRNSGSIGAPPFSSSA